jgi:cellobiose-specific phosphotransferase system component IIC
MALLDFLSIFDLGEYVIPICLAAFLLWHFGVHDAFLLTAISFAVGLPIGFVIDRNFGTERRARRRKRGAA